MSLVAQLQRAFPNRRGFLRGLGGAALALPALESLAGEDHADASDSGAPKRIVFFYVPIGVVRRGFFPGEADAAIPRFIGDQKEIPRTRELKVGTHEIQWTPTLQPLKKLRDEVTLVTGLDRTFQQGTDVHAQCASCYLSSAAPFTITQSAWPLDRTVDHLIADKIGRQTPFRTLEFSCNSHKDNRESIHFDNISWYGTGHVAPSVRDPRKMYRRLFGTQEAERFRNITDLVLEDARSMRRDLSRSDQQKFEEYFDSLRSIETQMARLESLREELSKVQLDEPAVAHLPRGEYIRLMADLLVVALQNRLTRVSTFMVGPERWDTPFLFESLFDKPRSHHQMSHNQGKFIKELLAVDRFHMEQYAYLCNRLRQIKEPDGQTLLDNTLVTYGSGLGDGATHQYTELPIIVAGGKLPTAGKHVNLAKGTPLANLWLTQARTMGVSMERFADSTGTVAPLR